MDAILALPPDLPPHDRAPREPVPHRIVAEWPVGTFLENLAVLPDGDIAVSVLSEARIDRVSGTGEVRTWHQFDAPPTGLAVVDGALFAAVGEPGAGEPTLWRLDARSDAAEPWMKLAGVGFANGLTPFDAGRLLLAESWLGQLVLVDLAARRTETWLAHELLTRAPGIDFLPGANGVKRWRDEVMVSSNGRALLIRVRARGGGKPTGFEVVADRLRVDDLAYDTRGRAYLCTHIGHSLDRLDRDGRRVELAGPGEGLAGSTACAFHPDGGLYVVTTGGIVMPPGGTLQPARLVRLEAGVVGQPLDHAWEKDA